MRMFFGIAACGKSHWEPWAAIVTCLVLGYDNKSKEMSESDLPLMETMG